MDIDWKVFLTAVALIWGIANSFWTRYVATQAVNKKEIEKVSDKVMALDHQVTGLAAAVDQLPSKDFVHRIEKAQIALEGDMNTVKESLKPIGKSVTRIEDYLLSGAFKK